MEPRTLRRLARLLLDGAVLMFRFCLLIVLTLSAGQVLAAEPGLVEFQTAMKLYRSGDYRAAIARFEEAYGASGHRNALYYMGEAYRRLGERRKSHEVYTRYARLLPKAKQADFAKKLNELRFEVPCRVSVASSPGDATVTIDGSQTHRTPQDGSPLVLELAGGKHQARVELDGHAPAERSIVAEFGEPLALSFVLEPVVKSAKLVLESSVKGAEVVLDGRVVGRTPLDLDSVEPGEHQLVLTLEGHRPAHKRFAVQAGERLRLSVALERVPQVEDRPVTPEESPEPKQQDTGFFDRGGWWLVAGASSLAVAAVGLGVGIHYNRRYNDAAHDDPALQDHEDNAKLGYGLAGGFAVVSAASFIVYAVLRAKRQDTEVSFGPAPRGGTGALVTVRLAF